MAEEVRSGVHSPARKLQRPLRKEVNAMTDREQTAMLIDIYTNLQRIKAAKAKLEASGVVTEDLDIR